MRTTFARNMVELGPRASGAPTGDGPYGIHVVRDGATNVDTTFADNVIATRDGVRWSSSPSRRARRGSSFTGNTYDTGGAAVSIVGGRDPRERRGVERRHRAGALSGWLVVRDHSGD